MIEFLMFCAVLLIAFRCGQQLGLERAEKEKRDGK